MFLCADGHVFTVGDGSSGSLGHGDTTSHLLPKLVEWFANHGVRCVSIVAAGGMAAATALGGKVYAWGSPPYGSLQRSGSALRDMPELTLIPTRVMPSPMRRGGGYAPRNSITGWGLLELGLDLRAKMHASNNNSWRYNRHVMEEVN